jgi:hypothetical protein
LNIVLLQQFNDILKTLDDRDYLLAKVACEVAPTLLGIKPASLMSFSAYTKNLCQLWEKYQREVCSVLQLQYFEMKKTERHTLVLFYHHDMLARILDNNKSKALLKSLGYKKGVTSTQILQILQKKIEHVFPHEIGLLLGIPPEDVIGFINNKGENCLLCGYWKVYHNPQHAGNIFQIYDMTKSKVMQQICNMQKLENTSA